MKSYQCNCYYMYLDIAPTAQSIHCQHVFARFHFIAHACSNANYFHLTTSYLCVIQTAGCNATFEEFKNTYAKASGELIVSADSIEACKHECIQRPACVGFDFNGKTSSSWFGCWIYTKPSDVETTTAMDGVDFYRMKECHAGTSPYYLLQKTTPWCLYFRSQSTRT